VRQTRRQSPRSQRSTGSASTIYNWRQHFGGLEAADVKRLKQLEQENARLKKMLAERDLELDVIKEINAKMW
jgi:Transposase